MNNEKDKIGITTDCVCDLPDEYVSAEDIGLIYFYITTDSGRFRDRDEISSVNILEYLEAGGQKAVTNAPPVDEYISFFRDRLKRNHEVIHITISSGTSDSYRNATEALESLGEDKKKVHVFDSKHLSTGMGHMVIKAVEMKEAGNTAQEILSELSKMQKLISTTFMTHDADYLFRNGRMGKTARNICRLFSVHPVLTLSDGDIKLKKVTMGSYERAVKHYIKGELKESECINKKRLFITHAGCSVKTLSMIKSIVKKYCDFDEIIVTKASATVSSNCGPNTFGLLYQRQQTDNSEK